MRSLRTLAALAGAVCLAVPAAGARDLSVEDRVAAQRAIEQVYWSHRIWPAENPGPKPPLAAILSDADLRARVEDYLAKSSALAELWQRPITAVQLQAEMGRMAASTHDAAVLSELFAALGNDARTIAETLARQTLADRLIREWYAHDTRYHGTLKERAEAALASCADAGCMNSLGGEYRETVWRPSEASTEPSDPLADNGTIPLDAAAWEATLARLAKMLGGPRDGLPTSKLTDLEESAEDFSITAVLSQGADEITTATVSWAKEPFDDWWSVERGKFGTTLVEAAEEGEFQLPAIPDAGCVDDTWSPPMPLEVPDPRTSHTAVWTGTEMIVWGGIIELNGPRTRTGGRYNPSTDTWTATSIGANVPAARSGHTAVWTGTQMIVGGGIHDMVGWVNTGGSYNPSTDTWTATSTGANVPAARYEHTAVWTGTVLIVWGGSNNASPFNTGGRYDPSTDAWTATSTTSAPVARYDHTAVWTGTVMVVWGGFDGTDLFRTGGRYNPSTNTWATTSVGANVPTARRRHAAVWTGSVMVVWSGLDITAPQNTGGRYNPTTNAWTATATTAGVPGAGLGYCAVWSGSEMIVWISPNNPGGRYNPTTNAWTAMSTGPNAPDTSSPRAAVWTGSEMIVWGGGLAPVYNTGARYSPATNTWVRTSTGTTVPIARTWHSAVWTGIEMVVWGGHNVSVRNTGGRYIPATNSWTPTSTGANLPAARADHTATWTGKEMIVWGGIASVVLDSGGRYDPALDAWSATSTGANVPQGRANHTAVWTGTEIIVWGGSGTGSLNTGGRYAPSTDTWTSTSTGANVPAGRALHTAVWAGDKMVVWGGSGGGNLNTGGRYDPVANSWLPTSTGANVPEIRTSHVAAWTGTQMIVWGGDGGSFSMPLNTGGRYDPVGDAWTPTAVPPPAVAGGTAVWTGTEMIVWGGLEDEYDGGGRYAPASNSWTTTSMTDVPQARWNHSAVWSGTEMIVWGGQPRTATGGRYCACASPLLHYRDLDGDGYGNAATTTMSCAGAAPAGWVAAGTDCNDANAAIHPGATELCNDIDDDCSNGPDDGFVVPGLPALALGSAGGLSWSAVLPSTGYDVVRGDLVTLVTTAGNFTAATTDCLENDTAATLTNDGDPPAVGGGFWYLVRAVNCHTAGSWSSGGPGQQGSRDAEIATSAGACP